MSRLTGNKKDILTNYKVKRIDENWTVNIQNCIDKLGKLEDLLEKHGIDDFETLDVLLECAIKNQEKIIELSADLGMYQNENTKLTKDIEKYWELQEELGCPLEVVFKKIKELTEDDWRGTFTLQYDLDKKLWCIVEYYRCNDGLEYSGMFYLKDYKKIWWLRGEKNENN